MAKSPKSQQQRVFKNQKEITHDLYKLEVNECLKNVAWQEKVKKWEKIEHTHFFHSVTDKGVPQFTSTHTAGHFHELKLVQEATEASPAIYECSGPLKYVYSRQEDGSYKKTTTAYEGQDRHTHDVTYLRSEKFKPRKMNAEAVNFITQQASKTAPIDGIIG